MGSELSELHRELDRGSAGATGVAPETSVEADAQALDHKGDSPAQSRRTRRTGVDEQGNPLPRREARTELSPRDYALWERLQKHLDMSGSDVVRQALRQMAVTIWGPRALR